MAALDTSAAALGAAEPVVDSNAADERRFTHLKPSSLSSALAAVGALFVLGEVAIWVAWIAGPHFKATDPGPDHLPWATHMWIVLFQIVSPLAAVLTIVLVVRKCIRQRRLVFDAVAMIAWVTCYIQDPFINWVRPGFTYNAHLFNRGSWSSEVPGWISPLGGRLPEPLIFMGVAYFWMALLATIITSKVMSWAADRYPTASVLRLFFYGYGAMVLFDLAFELPWVHAGLYAYPGAVHWLSLWPGHTYQFPVYEALIFPFVWASMGALRFGAERRRDNLSFVELGAPGLTSRRMRPAVRILAVTAFIQIVFNGAYNIPMCGITHYGGPWPKDLPSYLTDGLCGPPTPYSCPTPHSPIDVR